jgi:male-specific lethal 1
VIVKKEDTKTTIIDENIGKHIMISYNRESRDLCLKIKSELESQNLKVWIDTESISGSSLESMALAIENSFCVLMCMTEKYKQSPNCRAEAEYAFTLNKSIIPLIMQVNYKPGIEKELYGNEFFNFYSIIFLFF